MKKLIILFVMVILSLTACSLGQQNAGEPPTPTVAAADAIRTSAAKTVDALSTALAGNKTSTPAATSTVQATVPLLPSSTPLVPTLVPSLTPPPSRTPTITATQPPCDQVALVKDTTVPDGTYFTPNTPFTKTWELKNIGSCAWNSYYSIVFIEGNLMKASTSKPLVPVGISVAPGQSVQVSVDMVAPGTKGKQSGLWKLKNPKGEVFGVGAGGLKSFWVEINVAEKFSLIENLCSAEWKNSTEVLPCPGKAGDAKGYLLKDPAPKFISGYTEDEPGILMVPQAATDGLIVGKFPPVLLPAKPKLITLVVCAFNAAKCDAKVLLTAQQVGTSDEVTLLDVQKTAANDTSPVTIDLAAKGLAGKTVVFRMYVKANGAATDDRIYWVNPSLDFVP